MVAKILETLGKEKRFWPWHKKTGVGGDLTSKGSKKRGNGSKTGGICL